MTWVIYQEGSQKMYVTEIDGYSVGHFGGPGALREAVEWDDKADALKALEWLNDPETFYGPQKPHVLEESLKP
jgi:hypothetical protein